MVVGTMRSSPATMSELPRRLSDKLLAAFDQACEQGQVEIAELVLKAIELVLTQEAAPVERERRSHLGPVIEAFGRLKALREKVASYPHRD
jgi:hypothetical protein